MNDIPVGIWHQNLVLDGKELSCENPRRRFSKFWNEGKWNTFIKPLLPKDPSELTFVEIGSNVGLYLKMAKEYGFKRVVGVESDKNNCEMAKYYRDKLGLDYRIINRTVGKDFKFSDVPMADVLLLANVHFYISILPFIKFLDEMFYKTVLCIVVSRNLMKPQHWSPPVDFDGLRLVFKNWKCVGAIRTTPEIVKGDPHPRTLWSLAFQSELERSPLEIHFKKHNLRRDIEHMTKLVMKGKLNPKRTRLYRKWKGRKGKKDTKEQIIAFVKNKINLAKSVMDNGQIEPLFIHPDNSIMDGGTRLDILQTLGEKSAIIRRI